MTDAEKLRLCKMRLRGMSKAVKRLLAACDDIKAKDVVFAGSNVEAAIIYCRLLNTFREELAEAGRRVKEEGADHE